MVFQSYALYPHMSCRDNMAFGLKLAGFEARDERPRVHARRRRSCRSSTCSSASRRRCPAASASAWRSAAPSCASRRCSCSTSRCRTSTPRCACRCASRLARLHERAADTTMIYVTHDQVEAMTLADRIVVLQRRPHRAGRHADGAVPRARRTASSPGFIGSPKMNFLDGVLHDGGHVRLNDGTCVPVIRRHGRGSQHGAKVTLGIRPEHIQLATGTTHRRGRQAPSCSWPNTWATPRTCTTGRATRRAADRCAPPATTRSTPATPPG